MMFIKTVFVLYFAAISLAAPTPQPLIDIALKLVNKLDILNDIAVANGALGGHYSEVNNGGGRLRTSCLNSCPLSTSLIRPT
jgi:hypothetical protein